MYYCGPTVYQRIHVGNARPSSSRCGFNWLNRRGYDMTLVENITDVNDKIYDGGSRRSASSPRTPRGWYIEDTDGVGLGRPDHEPNATETIPEIVALIEELVERGHAYAADGDVYFRVARFPGYGRLSGQQPDEEATSNPPRRPRARSRTTRATSRSGRRQARRGHVVGLAVGPRPAGLAHRVLGHGREVPRAGLRDHGGGLDLVFPHHENEIAQSRAQGASSRGSGCTTGCCASPARRCRSRSATSSRSRGARRVGPGDAARLLPHRALAQADRLSDEVLEQAAARAESLRKVFRGEPGEGGDSGGVAAALEDDFNTAEALACCTGGATTNSCAAGWRSSGSSRSPRWRRRRPSCEELARARLEARKQKGLRDERPSPRGDRGGRLGGARRRGRTWLPTGARAVTSELVYGRGPVREALRGRRAVVELWATERA